MIIIGQYKAIIRDFSIFSIFFSEFLTVIFSGFLDKIEGSGANREVREGPGIHFLQFWSRSDGGMPPTRQQSGGYNYYNYPRVTSETVKISSLRASNDL